MASTSDDPGETRFRSKELSAVDAELLGAPLRLLPLYDAPQVAERRLGGGTSFVVASDANVAPGVLLRVSGTDFSHVCSAVGEVIEPAAIVVALSEERKVVAAASRAAGRAHVPFAADPVFFRCALRGARIPKSLGDLRYAPGVRHGPWKAGELTPAAVRRLVREVFSEQSGRQRGLWFGATVLASGHDGSLPLVDQLLGASIRTHASWGRDPLIAPLVIDVAAFATVGSQLRLARLLAHHRPQAYFVAVAGLHAGSSAGRIVSALRLLLILQAGGVPVLLAKAGPLRRWAAAFGLAGYECGLGRLERFNLNDYRGVAGGPGFWPAKFEIPALLAALQPALAARVLASGVLSDEPCSCAACAAGWQLGDAAGTVTHDASVISSELSDVAGRRVPERVERFRRQISDGRYMVDDLLEAGVDVRKAIPYLARWAEALELARREGLDDPACLQRLLSDAA